MIITLPSIKKKRCTQDSSISIEMEFLECELAVKKLGYNQEVYQKNYVNVSDLKVV